MYVYVPGDVKVTRKCVTPKGVCGRGTLSCDAATIKPECVRAPGELSTAVLAPSTTTVTSPEGGWGIAGSVPNVTVWGVTGSKFVHSTVSPTRTTIVPCRNRFTDMVCVPPLVATIAPMPAVTSFL